MARGYAACDGDGRWRIYGTRVAAVGDVPVEVVLGPGWPRCLMPEQKIEVPARPRREKAICGGSTRERSTRDCQAECPDGRSDRPGQEDRIRPLMETFGSMLIEQRAFREVFGVI